MKRLTKLVDQLDSSTKFRENTVNSSNINNVETSEYHSGNNSGNTSGIRYTLDSHANRAFTKEERQFYDENGYIVVKKLLNTEEVKYFYDRFDYLVKNPKKRGGLLVMRDVSLAKKEASKRTNPDEVTKLQLWSREPGLWKYPTNNKIVKYVSAFCGDNIRAMHFMVINKPKDSGALSSRHPMHQDQWYFPYGPSDHIVCSWTALEIVNRRNGCLSVIPGSHKKAPGGKLLEHGYPRDWNGPVNKAYHAVQVDNINKVKRDRVHLEMEPGDTVFFHPLLLHASGANLTHKTRRSISVHFASSTLCSYHNWTRAGQIKISKEVNDMARKLTKNPSMKDIPYDVIWKNKSRQVTGKSGNLG